MVTVKNDTLITTNQGALRTTEKAPKRKLSHSSAAARAALRADSDRTDKDIEYLEPVLWNLRNLGAEQRLRQPMAEAPKG